MKNNGSNRLGHCVLAAALLSAPLSAPGVEIGEHINVHGYGNVTRVWADTVSVEDESANTDSNEYDFSFLGTFDLTDKARLWGQIAYLSDTRSVRLDWAFLDYSLTPGLSVHAGQVRMPFGLFNEVRDVEFIRSASRKAILYSEDLELATEAFRGASLIHQTDLFGGSIATDLYGGIATVTDDGDVDTGRIFGARVKFDSPVQGLTFAASGYGSSLTEADGEHDHRRAWAVSADYLSDTLRLTAEYGGGRVFDAPIVTWYAEASYTFAVGLKPYFRYDYATTDSRQKDNPAFYQKISTLGVAYDLTTYLGVRLERAFNRGYALPVFEEEVEPGEGRLNWNSTVFSVSYRF